MENDEGVETPGTRPLRPTRVASWEAPASPIKVDVLDDIVALALGDGGGVLIDVGCVNELASK